MSKLKRLTQYSPGSGCGCKISPMELEKILKNSKTNIINPKLWVDNSSRDDAAIYGLDNVQGIVSTADFFMPIVDDAYDFGRIAATNAISDVYAMGGKPVMAIGLLGWPIDLLPAETASEVILGAQYVCNNLGISLAGGHSINSSDPIFGLAVTGLVKHRHIKRNNSVVSGCLLYLTKPLGTGILSTAEKEDKLLCKDRGVARDWMCLPNIIGTKFSEIDAVVAMTDVTGFGLLGHLTEMLGESNCSAQINFSKVPRMDSLDYYIDIGCIPGGSLRNFQSYGDKISPMENFAKCLLCDPQTSGGLLVAVKAEYTDEFLNLCQEDNLLLEPIGEITQKKEYTIEIL